MFISVCVSVCLRVFVCVFVCAYVCVSVLTGRNVGFSRFRFLCWGRLCSRAWLGSGS